MDVWYWFFNLGNVVIYNFNVLKDEDVKLDVDGYVNIVLVSFDEVVEV